ncbi:SWIM zinc finger family protein, partial [Embleya sp. NPDC005575]|uniref:SWIM zinc finger family protein n=1 Tax=Embleya sp. NPDC005575 TaxID=3156892 RepID=UPI0033A4ECC0
MLERWTAEQVLALAPDAASRKAGSRLAVPRPWSAAGAAEFAGGAGAVWGVCAGSGVTPYRTVVDLTGPASQCSCPSRKFPCKHVLGLLLLWAADPVAVHMQPVVAQERARPVHPVAQRRVRQLGDQGRE